MADNDDAVAGPAEHARGAYPRVLQHADVRGRVQVGYVVGSEFQGQDNTVVLTIADLGGWLDLNGGELRNVRKLTSVPLGAEVRALGTALAAAGFAAEDTGVIRRGITLRTTPAIAASAALITGERDPYYAGATIVVLLAPEVTFNHRGEQQDGPDDAVAQHLGAFRAAPPADDGAPRVVNPDTGRPIGNPRAVWDTLRDYRLAADPVALPYTNVDANAPVEGADENCLRRYLKQRYHTEVTSKKKRLSLKMIDRRLDAANDGGEVTGASLLAFAASYKIRTILLDVGGRVIYSSARDYEHNKDHRPLVALIYGNHVYPYTDNLRSRIKLSLGAETDLHEYADDRYVAPADAQETTAFDAFLKTSFTPNFHYGAESTLTHLALYYYSATPPPETAQGWDMNAAYDSVTREIAAATEEIPVFTAHDVIEEFDPRIDEVAPHAYYWVRPSTFARWAADPAAPVYAKARVNDLMFGFEALYLIAQGALTAAEITHHKVPSYTHSLERFRKKLDEVCGEGRDKSFPLYNGLLGRSYTRDGWMCFTGASPADVALLAASRDAAALTYGKVDGDGYQVRIKVRFGSYLHFNNRNIYNWVVARTNLAVSEMIHETLAANPGAAVHKVKTDGVLFDRPVTLPARWAARFHPEAPKWSPHTTPFRSTEPANARANTLAEIVAWRDRTRVITGAPGTGKTHLIKGEDAHDLAMTTTNACARNLDTERVKGETIYKALQLFSPDRMAQVIAGLRGKTVWLDEFSMVQRYIWSYLFVIGSTVDVTILTGDPHQLPPVGERLDYGGTFLTTLFHGGKVLTKDWRNDARLIALRDIVRDKPNVVTLTLLEKLAERTPTTTLSPADDPSAYGTHLVRTNVMRKRLNAYIAQQRGLTWAHRLKREAAEPEGLVPKFKRSRAFTFAASAGLTLCARLTRKRSGIYKGSRYALLTEVDADSTEFSLQRAGADAPTTHPVQDLRLFDLGYALTVDSSQGLTVREPFVIWQARSMLVGPRADSSRLYTAITRGCRFDDLRIVLAASHAKLQGVAPLPEIDWKELGVDEDAFGSDGFSFRG